MIISQVNSTRPLTARRAPQKLSMRSSQQAVERSVTMSSEKRSSNSNLVGAGVLLAAVVNFIEMARH